MLTFDNLEEHVRNLYGNDFDRVFRILAHRYLDLLDTTYDNARPEVKQHYKETCIGTVLFAMLATFEGEHV